MAVTLLCRCRAGLPEGLFLKSTPPLKNPDAAAAGPWGDSDLKINCDAAAAIGPGENSFKIIRGDGVSLPQGRVIGS